MINRPTNWSDLIFHPAKCRLDDTLGYSSLKIIQISNWMTFISLRLIRSYPNIEADLDSAADVYTCQMSLLFLLLCLTVFTFNIALKSNVLPRNLIHCYIVLQMKCYIALLLNMFMKCMQKWLTCHFYSVVSCPGQKGYCYWCCPPGFGFGARTEAEEAWYTKYNYTLFCIRNRFIRNWY